MQRVYTRFRALLNRVEVAAPPSLKNEPRGNGRSFMQRTTPPFRADHVGSLLRPQALKEARAKRDRNEITAEALAAIEDREIERAIRKQEEIGPEACDRRRIAPHLVAVRFLPRSRWRGNVHR